MLINYALQQKIDLFFFSFKISILPHPSARPTPQYTSAYDITFPCVDIFTSLHSYIWKLNVRHFLQQQRHTATSIVMSPDNASSMKHEQK